MMMLFIVFNVTFDMSDVYLFCCCCLFIDIKQSDK